MTEEKEEPQQLVNKYIYFNDEYSYDLLEKAVWEGFDDFINSLGSTGRYGRRHKRELAEATEKILAGIKAGNVTYTGGRFVDTKGELTNIKKRARGDYNGLMATHIYNTMKRMSPYKEEEKVNPSLIPWNKLNPGKSLGLAVLREIFKGQETNWDLFDKMDLSDKITALKNALIAIKNDSENQYSKYFTGYDSSHTYDLDSLIKALEDEEVSLKTLNHLYNELGIDFSQRFTRDVVIPTPTPPLTPTTPPPLTPTPSNKDEKIFNWSASLPESLYEKFGISNVELGDLRYLKLLFPIKKVILRSKDIDENQLKGDIDFDGLFTFDWYNLDKDTLTNRLIYNVLYLGFKGKLEKIDGKYYNNRYGIYYNPEKDYILFNIRDKGVPTAKQGGIIRKFLTGDSINRIIFRIGDGTEDFSLIDLSNTSLANLLYLDDSEDFDWLMNLGNSNNDYKAYENVIPSSQKKYLPRDFDSELEEDLRYKFHLYRLATDENYAKKWAISYAKANPYKSNNTLYTPIWDLGENTWFNDFNKEDLNFNYKNAFNYSNFKKAIFGEDLTNLTNFNSFSPTYGSIVLDNLGGPGHNMGKWHLNFVKLADGTYKAVSLNDTIGLTKISRNIPLIDFGLYLDNFVTAHFYYANDPDKKEDDSSNGNDKVDSIVIKLEGSSGSDDGSKSTDLWTKNLKSWLKGLAIGATKGTYDIDWMKVLDTGIITRANKRAERTLIDNTRVAYKSPINIQTPVVGNFTARQKSSQLGADIMRQASKPFISDANEYRLAMLHAGNERFKLDWAGYLEDNKAIKESLDQALQNNIKTLTYNTQVADANRLAIADYWEKVGKIKGTTIRANAETWKGLLTDIITDRDNKRDETKGLFQNLLGYLNNMEYEKLLAKLKSRYLLYKGSGYKESDLATDTTYASLVSKLRKIYNILLYNTLIDMDANPSSLRYSNSPTIESFWNDFDKDYLIGQLHKHGGKLIKRRR